MLVPEEPVLEEVSFPSLILSPQTILVKDRVEFSLCLGGDVVIVILIAGIFPRASSSGAHGSQSNDSTYLVSDMRCSLYLTLDQQVVFSVARITGVANLPLRMWSSSKKHQLILSLAPGPGVEPGSRGHEADALPLSYPHIPGR